MMTPEQVTSEVSRMSIDERKRLISLIVDSLAQPPTDKPRRKRSVLEFEGVGAHAREQREPQDAQEYINQLRSEWDHRP